MKASAIVFAACAAAYAPAQTSRDQARLQDLNFITTQLPKLHANFFFQLNPADFTSAANTLQNQIPSLTDAQFYVGLARLVAMAGDAHTYLTLTDSAAVSAGFQSFPLIFKWLEDGVFVTGAAPQYSRAIGTRLIEIGTTPIDQAVTQLATVIPSANPQWLHHRVEQYLQGQQILQGLGLLPPGAASPLTFQDLAGNQFTLQVSTASGQLTSAPDPSAGPIPLYQQNTGLNYWYTYSAAERLLYIHYRVCADDPANPFAIFSANVLHTLDTNPVDTLVFDFRDNVGGDANVINPLLNGVGQRAPALLANPAFRVYDVINKGTFSSGMDDAAELKSDALQFPALSNLLTVIGEPTGGKPGEYGSVQPFTLPASKLNGQYSTAFLDPPPGIPTGPAFNPDIAVSTRSPDYFARFDPVMAAILARSSGAAPPPSGNVIAVNGASFRTENGLSPGSFASAFGSFTPTPDKIVVGGAAAQIISVSASQVNFIVPASLPPGPTSIAVLVGGVALGGGKVTISASSPGLFILQPADSSQPGAVENQDYSVNSSSNPAAQGSVIQIFWTGCTGAPVQAFLQDPAEVLYSGPVAQYPGLCQINARVPNTVHGQGPLYVISGNAASNAVTVWVQ